MLGYVESLSSHHSQQGSREVFSRVGRGRCTAQSDSRRFGQSIVGGCRNKPQKVMPKLCAWLVGTVAGGRGDDTVPRGN